MLQSSRSTLQRLAMQTTSTSRAGVAGVPRRRVSSSSSSPARDLPRLPVPDLHQTLQRYLKSLEPFLLEDEAAGGPSFQVSYEARSKWAEDFEQGVGRLCQARLHALDQSSQHNWLDENFWLKKAYHEWRAPLIVNSNWWLCFHHDANVPEDVLLGRVPVSRAGTTEWQLRRSASLVHGILDWKARLAVIHPESTRTGLWLHDTTAQIFNVCRIPQLQCDTFSTRAIPSHPDTRKVLVFIHDWLYAVEVLDEKLDLLSADEIRRRLNAVVMDVCARLDLGEVAVPVAILGTDERDRWAKNLQHLLSLSSSNASTFGTISHSLMTLSLDTAPADASHVPGSPEEVTAHLHAVRSGAAANRWWDKPLTLFVERTARGGASGEHSPVDALVPSMLADYALAQGVPLEGVHDIAVHGWERLDWVTDARVERECAAAAARAQAIIADSDDSVLWFDAYGGEWIKSTAGFAPDAYIQLAMQLAWYRSRGGFTATYETALTRLYKHGRTETIRSLTTESRGFVLAMCDPKVSAPRRLALLRSAVDRHSALTRQAMLGRGVDRHLLGLSQMLDAGAHHALFDDALFARSQTWKLSTSGLSEGSQFRGTGFGTVCPDGYGINYLTGADLIKFGIESKHSCPETSTEQFKTFIAQALLDMRAVCTGGHSAHL